MQVRGRMNLLFVAASAGLVVLLAALSAYLLPAHAVGSFGSAVKATRSIALRVPQPVDNQAHLYVLDGWGGVHPVGASPTLAATASWPTRDIAFSLALFPSGSGGYVMDGWGKLHPVGDAPPLDSGVYWPHWAGARQVVMAPWSSSADPAGYLLDADGNVHAFGGTPPVRVTVTLPAQNVMRGLVLTANSSRSSVMGYTLDAFGGIHPFGGAPPVQGAAYWAGQDMARGLVLLGSRNAESVEGYTLDASGVLHPFGGAPAVTVSASWAGQDVADSVVSWTAAPAGRPGGWVLDRHGAVHAYGSAPALAASQTWPGWDIARGLAGAGSGAGSIERLILEPEVQSDAFGRYFNQRDTRWATGNVGPASVTVWKVGCLLSDLAMVYNHFGYTTVTPGSVAAHAGWFNLGGAIYNSALDIPGHAKTVVTNPGPSWISAQLTAGHPVIVGMNLPLGGTHFVTLTGMDGASDWWTDDPWEQNAMHVTFSGDWSDRGPIYEAIAFS